ncbi:laccase domain-containing protein [Rothia nasimurium]|uniref:laccase domain-containing protein n=1 Tax=Rothia nasimurium TaxID=85336 RepID=UPI003B9F8104
MEDLLFSRATVSTANGSTVHVGFTSMRAGNLGLHVGEDLPGILADRSALDRALLGEKASCGFTYLNQVHGTTVYNADKRQELKGLSPEDMRAAAPEADAASSFGTPLAIMVADCIPLVFVGEHQQTGAPVLGVAHAGRKGLLDGVIQAEISDMVARGAGNIKAWIGPSICGRCYEVPEQMQRESVALIPEVKSETSWGTPGLDLPAGAVAVLKEIPQVTSISQELAACTFETPDLYSHRGHTQRGEEAGRIAGLVWVEACSSDQTTKE